MSTHAELGNNISEVKVKATLGGGAQFWAYISPMNDTASKLTSWQVRLEQGNWVGFIDSDDPQQILQTPELSGVFSVTVTAVGPKMPQKQLSPGPDSKPNVGCNSNCAAMVGIVANEDGTAATYWTTWDAICNP